jgi:hypothetical protein
VDAEHEREADRQRSCTGKAAMSARIARGLAREIRERGEPPLQAYHCRYCAAWHLGHPMTMSALERLAALIRVEHGGEPVPPGSGTTRRRRRRA